MTSALLRAESVIGCAMVTCTQPSQQPVCQWTRGIEGSRGMKAASSIVFRASCAPASISLRPDLAASSPLRLVSANRHISARATTTSAVTYSQSHRDSDSSNNSRDVLKLHDTSTAAPWPPAHLTATLIGSPDQRQRATATCQHCSAVPRFWKPFVDLLQR